MSSAGLLAAGVRAGKDGRPPGGGPPVLDCVKGVFAGVCAQATESRQAFVFMKTGARTPENQPTDAA